MRPVRTSLDEVEAPDKWHRVAKPKRERSSSVTSVTFGGGKGSTIVLRDQEARTEEHACTQLLVVECCICPAKQTLGPATSNRIIELEPG